MGWMQLNPLANMLGLGFNILPNNEMVWVRALHINPLTRYDPTQTQLNPTQPIATLLGRVVDF